MMDLKKHINSMNYNKINIITTKKQNEIDTSISKKKEHPKMFINFLSQPIKNMAGENQ